jgi:hypothetical protein
MDLEQPAKQPTAFAKAQPSIFGRPYKEMTRRQKVFFIIKLVLCIATFGFAFPTVSTD